jgi:hypothetical protein
MHNRRSLLLCNLPQDALDDFVLDLEHVYFEQYREWRTQGISARQAAKELKVPRTTLQAWRLWHDTLDICPHVAEFFQSGPDLAFLQRCVIACHLIYVEVGAWGIRLVCLFLHLTGRNRFVASAYGAQQQVNCQGEHAIVDSRHSETARLAQNRPHKDLTVAQDATGTGGLGLVTMDPDSNGIIWGQSVQARDQTTWNERLAPALAPLNCRVIPSTSDEAPGLLASVAHDLEAHHSPDLFHVQHAWVKAVSGPMATTERAAYKAVSEAQEQHKRLQSDPKSAGDAPEERCPGHPQGTQALGTSRANARSGLSRARATRGAPRTGQGEYPWHWPRLSFCRS